MKHNSILILTSMSVVVAAFAVAFLSGANAAKQDAILHAQQHMQAE